MKKTPLHYGKRALLVLASGLLLSHSCLMAADVLFEDRFGSDMFPSEQTQDFNIDLAARQSGSLAPVAYSESENGRPWQSQASPSQQSMDFRLYFKSQWFGISPKWELKEDDGNYSLTLDLRFHRMDPENSLEGIIAIGRTEPQASETNFPDLHGTFAVTIEVGSEPSIPIWNNGNEMGSAPLPSVQTLVVTWTQKGAEISNMKVSINGTKVDADSGPALTLANPQIMIAGRSMSNVQEGAIPALQLNHLTCSKG